MHDMFFGRQAGVAMATGVGHKPGGDSIFDWLRGGQGVEVGGGHSGRDLKVSRLPLGGLSKLMSLCLDSPPEVAERC